ncbi:MAG TPA: hypothetical protein VGA98_04865 [Allosphingosinicella sp.]
MAEAERLLGEIMKTPGLPEQQLAAAGELTLRLWRSSRSLAETEAVAAPIRARYLEALAFTALARLEAVLWQMRVQGGEVEHAAKMLGLAEWAADLAAPAARSLLLAFRAASPSVPMTGRLRQALATARYFGVMDTDAEEVQAATADPGSAGHGFAIEDEIRGDLDGAVTATEAETALRAAVGRLRAAGALTPQRLARLRGERGNNALNQQRFAEASRHYRRAERLFRRLGEIGEAISAVAGAARAASHGGDFEGAKTLFMSALEEAGNGPKRAELLRGLGAAQLLEATERRVPADMALLDEAITTLAEAVASAPDDAKERAFSRLAWARAKGERGDQDGAMEALDLAISELAHLGRAEANILITHRDQFLGGQWQALQLA